MMRKEWMCVYWRVLGWLLLLGLAMLGPGVAAQAATVSVNCSRDSINAVLSRLDATGPHTITVTGTCSENVVIGNRQNVTLQGPATLTASAGRVLAIGNATGIVLQRLVISGAAGMLIFNASKAYITGSSIENSARQGVVVNGGSELTIDTSTVRNNNLQGIGVNGSVLAVAGDVTIEGNREAGIRLGDHSRGSIEGFTVQGNVIRDNLRGIAVSWGSSVALDGQNTIQNNTEYGLQVGWNSLADISENTLDGTPLVTIIEGSGGSGLVLFGSAAASLSAAKIRNNGTGHTGDPWYRGSGIIVAHGASLSAEPLVAGGPGVEITNNLGPGILADATGTLFLDGSTISNNNGDGIRLLHLSAAELSSFKSPNTITGNQGAGIFCDKTSVTFGNLAGILRIGCK